MTNQTHKAIFDTLTCACLAEGGDGDVALLCPDYRRIADNFDTYLKESGNPWWERNDHENYVTFHHDQECIYLAENDLGFHSSLTINAPNGVLDYP